MYGYLLAIKRVKLPEAQDSLLNDKSKEIKVIIKMMLEIITNEKSLIKDVTNATIVALKQKDAVTLQVRKEKLDWSISQRKKLKAANKIKKFIKIVTQIGLPNDNVNLNNPVLADKTLLLLKEHFKICNLFKKTHKVIYNKMILQRDELILDVKTY